MRLFVTGATGYIGRRLVEHALQQGHEVIAATRQRPQDPRLGWVPFDFAIRDEQPLPERVDVVIHLAAVTTHSAIPPEMEISAARDLFAAAKRIGARILFISSQVARSDAPTPYGQTKWQIEQLANAAGACVVRPGQVYGGPERGLFGVLVNAVRKLPAMPAFLPTPMVQPIHVDDLAEALLRCCEEQSCSPRMLCLGSERPVSFSDFLRAIAHDRVRRPILLLPVPVVVVQLVIKLLGTHFASKLGLDKLNSLFDLPAMQTRDDLAALGLILRPLSSGMTKSGKDRRHRLIQEGRALLSYVLRAPPRLSTIKRYVLCTEDLRGGQAIGLPDLMLMAPSTIALLDHPMIRGTAKGKEFQWRLDATVVLAEASTQSATRFLGQTDKSGLFISGRRIASAVLADAAWRLLRMMARPWLKRQLSDAGFRREG